jgi:putative redox protein
MASQSVEFQNKQGETLSGVLERPDGDLRGWALFAHCFTCSKTGLAAMRISRALAADGIGVLRFDFTGLGASSGDFSHSDFSSNVDDLIAAGAWMKTQGLAPRLLIGHSLGGAASIVAAKDIASIEAVVTLAAPSDAGHVVHQFGMELNTILEKGEAEVELAGRPFTLRKSFVEDVQRADVKAAAANLRKPLLIMHAPTDETVGVDSATELFVAAKHPKSFVSLDDAGHLLTRARDATYVAKVIAGWAMHYLAPEAPNAAYPNTHDVKVRETREAGPFQNEVFIDGQRHLADEPAAVGGGGTGPDPYAYVSAGLGACTAMTLRMYADRKGWPLERVTVNLNHAKTHHADCTDCGPKDKVDVFTREVGIEGDLTDEQRARLLEIADKCPVHRTLESVAVVETRSVTIPA